MANSTEGDFTMDDFTVGDTMVLYLGIFAPALITLIAGLVIHSFIIAVNVNDWRKGRSVTPVDQVVMSLGISRMCTQCAGTIKVFVFIASLQNIDLLTIIDDMDVMDFVYSFFSYASVWLTSLLSIVFCLKISSLRTRLFLYLRRMIEQRTAHCIVASGLISSLSCLLPLSPVVTKMREGETFQNITWGNHLDNCNVHYIYNSAIGVSIPLLFYCTSSIFLFLSLYRHTRRMKMSDNLSINLEPYNSVMKFIFFTFMYNIIYFTGLSYGVYYYYMYCDKLEELHIFFGFLSALHSSFLIYRTAKLRSHMSKILQNVVDFLLQRKGLESREDIEAVAQ